MPRNYDDKEADDFEKDDYDPDESESYPQGLYEDDGPATIPCPHCGEDVLEDSERCPNCEMYLSREDSPGKSRKGLWMILAVFALLAVLMWIVGCG
jgi:predicted nucleic acid-binding Zn ribbon protein